MTLANSSMATYKKLDGLHPELVEKVQRVLAAMAALGFPMMVTDGLRTTEQQQALFAKGRTAPGSIVTNADGVKAKSNHQMKADGFGHAVDCTFLDANGKPTWDGMKPWAAYGACAVAVGLTWGGNWKSKLVDRPHIELP
jgi:peptidoglycan L-alanyl-D-glutamate endopeptidase CwlK